MKILSALHHKIDASWPTASLRTYLVALILLATLPIAILMCYWIFTDIQGQRQRMQLELQQSANSLAQMVERELVSSIDALTILASTNAIQRHNINVFENSLRNTRSQLRPSWLSAYLLDEQGNLLFETPSSIRGERPHHVVPPPFPTPPPAAAGKPAARISNLVVDRWPEKNAIAIEVPVMIEGQPRYRLGAWIAAVVWQDLLNKAGTPPDAVAGLYDHELRLISRSKSPAAFGDDKLPATLVDSIGAAPAGIQRTPRSEHEATYDAWKTIALAGWVVDVGIPAGPLDARHNKAIGLALTTGIACLVLGVLLALLMARRLTRPLDQLATAPRSQANKRILIREVA